MNTSGNKPEVFASAKGKSKSGSDRTSNNEVTLTSKPPADDSSDVKGKRVMCRLCPNRIVGTIPHCAPEMQAFIRKVFKAMDLKEFSDGESHPEFSFCHECIRAVHCAWDLTEIFEKVVIQLDEALQSVEKREGMNKPGSSAKRTKYQSQRSKLRNHLMDLCKEKLIKRKEVAESVSFPNGEIGAGLSWNEASMGRIGEVGSDNALNTQEPSDGMSQMASGDARPVTSNEDQEVDLSPDGEAFRILVQTLKQEPWDGEDPAGDDNWMDVDHVFPAEMVQLADVKQEVEESVPYEEQDDTDDETVGDGTRLAIYVSDSTKRKRTIYNGVEIKRVFGTGMHSALEFLECSACGHLIRIPKPPNKRNSPFKSMKSHVQQAHAEDPAVPKPRRAMEPTCPLCFVKFASVKELKKHKSQQHAADANPECDICKKPFPKGTGPIHILNHKFGHKNDEEREAAIAAGELGTDNRKLANKNYGKCTSGVNSRKRQRNKTPSKEKSIPNVNQANGSPSNDAVICNLCGRSFKRQCYLTNHMKTHGVLQPSSPPRVKVQKRSKNGKVMREGSRKSGRRSQHDSVDQGLSRDAVNLKNSSAGGESEEE